MAWRLFHERYDIGKEYQMEGELVLHWEDPHLLLPMRSIWGIKLYDRCAYNMDSSPSFLRTVPEPLATYLMRTTAERRKSYGVRFQVRFLGKVEATGEFGYFLSCHYMVGILSVSHARLIRDAGGRSL